MMEIKATTISNRETRLRIIKHLKTELDKLIKMLDIAVSSVAEYSIKLQNFSHLEAGEMPAAVFTQR